LAYEPDQHAEIEAEDYVFPSGGKFMNGVGLQAYKRTDVITADPKKLVIMCYEGAIYSLKLAKAKFYAREYEAKGKAIQNALDILNELRGALDFERGGEIARNLDALYSFWTQHIIKADQDRDTRGLDQVAAMLEEIKSALEEAYFGRSEGQTLPLPFEKPAPRLGQESSGGFILG
jgi:flagellar secretion chaperone FliS